MIVDSSGGARIFFLGLGPFLSLPYSSPFLPPFPFPSSPFYLPLEVGPFKSLPLPSHSLPSFPSLPGVPNPLIRLGVWGSAQALLAGPDGRARPNAFFAIHS